MGAVMPVLSGNYPKGGLPVSPTLPVLGSTRPALVLLTFST